MSVRHSNEGLATQNDSVCTICRDTFSGSDEMLTTVCNHRFHRTCLLTWLRRNATCPTCRSVCNSRDFQPPVTRAQARQASAIPVANQNNNDNASNNKNEANERPTTSRSLGAVPRVNSASSVEGSPSPDQNRIRAIVTAVVEARQAAMLENLETRVAQLVETSIGNALNPILNRLSHNDMNRNVTFNLPAQNSNQNSNQNLNPHLNHNLNLNQNPNNIPNLLNNLNLNPNFNPNLSGNHNPHLFDLNWPTEMPNFENLLQGSPHINPNNQPRLSNASSITQSGKVAQLISNWDLKFDGSLRMSVENFIYRVESLTRDTLWGNFALLCEHAQCLFAGEAKDWYWRYRRSVERVTWPPLRNALRIHFEDYRTDSDFKDIMRRRKQGPTESFEDYKNSILKLSENLAAPLSERELIDILMHGLRPHTRQQLLFTPIQSVAQLRKYVLKGEYILSQIEKPNPAPANNATRPGNPRRQIFEVEEHSLNVDVPPENLEIDAINRNIPNNRLICWNCRKDSHRYQDCLEPRTIFCYGCGAQNTYKPNCQTCNPENPNVGGGPSASLRHN